MKGFIDFSFIGVPFFAEQSIRLAFPTRYSLIYAARLIGEWRLLTETEPGIETAEEVFKQELEAKRKFEKSAFYVERLAELRASLVVAETELLQAQKEQYRDKLLDAMAKYNTYVVALQPEVGLQMINAAKKYRKGDDFNDDGDHFNLPDIDPLQND